MRLFLTAILIVLLFSCKKGSSPSNTSCFTFPLNTNNRWIYKSMDRLGNFQYDTIKVVDKVNYNGKEYFTLNVIGPLRNVDCNTVSIYRSEVSREIPLSNIVAGDSIEIYNQTYLDSTGSCTHSEKWYGHKNKVDVDGRKCLRFDQLFFDCSNRITRKSVLYIAENIGIVRVDEYFSGSTIQMTMNLNSYTLN